ncbi:MAG: hypothetical protein ACLU38_09455 [Dysosmobacter sp.]
MRVYVALLAGCVLTMILGKFVLAELRKLEAPDGRSGSDGPTWHTIPRRSTPTSWAASRLYSWAAASLTFACGWRQIAGGGLLPICTCTCSP